MTSQNDSPSLARVLNAIRKQDEGELSKDDILAALREAGIADLETLATRLHERIRDCGDNRPRPTTTSDWQVLLKSNRGGAKQGVAHRAPTIPFVVDGVQYNPEQISQFDGIPLNFVLTGTATSDPVLLAYTNFAPILTYLEARWAETQLGIMHHQPKYCWGTRTDPFTGGVLVYQYRCGDEPHSPPPPPPPAPAAPPPTLIATFHEHFHYTSRRGGGSSISLRPNFLYSDLTDVYMSGIWPFDEDWNDQISAVTVNGATVVCAEHTDFGGSKIILSPRSGNTIDLVPLGWNDRISSMWNFGALF